MVSLSNHAQQHCHPAKLAPPDKNNRGCLSPPCKPRLFSSGPFHGELLPEPFESGEGRRVSGRATDPGAGRPVRLRGSICALEADIASVVDAKRQSCGHCTDGDDGPGLQALIHSPRGTGRRWPAGGQRQRAVFGSHYLSTRTRFDDRPSSQPPFNGQTRDEGVARGKHIVWPHKAYCLHSQGFFSNLCNALTGCQFARIG